MNKVSNIILVILLVFAIVAIPVVVINEINMAMHDADAFEDGRKAGLEGMPPSANPYMPTNYHWSPWQRGWQQGFRELKKLTN